MCIRTLFVLATASAVFLGLQPSAHSDAATDARRLIQSDYDRMDAAAARKDIGGVVAYNAPGYMMLGAHGNSGTLEQVRTTMFIFKAAGSLHGHSTVQSLSLSGSKATVIVRRLQEFTMYTLDPGTGRRDHFAYDILSRDTWLRGQFGWLRTTAERLSQKIKVNGILMSRKRPGLT